VAKTGFSPKALCCPANSALPVSRRGFVSSDFPPGIQSHLETAAVSRSSALCRRKSPGQNLGAIGPHGSRSRRAKPVQQFHLSGSILIYFSNLAVVVSSTRSGTTHQPNPQQSDHQQPHQILHKFLYRFSSEIHRLPGVVAPTAIFHHQLQQIYPAINLVPPTGPSRQSHCFEDGASSMYPRQWRTNSTYGMLKPFNEHLFAQR